MQAYAPHLSGNVSRCDAAILATVLAAMPSGPAFWPSTQLAHPVPGQTLNDTQHLPGPVIHRVM
jgi:hypothetical protein